MKKKNYLTLITYFNFFFVLLWINLPLGLSNDTKNKHIFY
jgi:hypothetical protein